MNTNNNKNNNNNNYNNEYFIKLYNLVFNNIVIKKIIFNHLKLYNLFLYINIEFESFIEWQQFKYKQYLNKVTILFDYDLNLLPENIKKLYIPPSINSTLESANLQSNKKSNQKIVIPNQIESLNIVDLNIENLNSTFLNSIRLSPILRPRLQTLYLNDEENGLVIQPHSIPQSISEVYFGIGLVKLVNGSLPNNLKKLYIRILSLKNECLPKSLTHLTISFQNESLLLEKHLVSLNNLIKLDYHGYRGGKIECFENIFPDSLQELSISCTTFNSKLPNNLKSFQLYVDYLDSQIQFPPSLEYLDINIENKKVEVFNSNIFVPPNLKTLIFTCPSTLDSNGNSIIPNKIEKLLFIDIEYSLFNQEPFLKANQLPITLTYLNFGPTFDQAIDINVLPLNLKTLIFGKLYSQPINPYAIPTDLQLLQIDNPKYTHLINLTPSSHPYTKVSCFNLDLYYDNSQTQLRVLKIPDCFNLPLSSVHLQDKSNLEYLYIGNLPIQLSDLPIQNNIKTLELSYTFRQTINLEFFQNLECIIINNPNQLKGTPSFITLTKNENNTLNSYNLKSIIVDPKLIKSLKYLDSSLYQFIKITNNK